MVGLASTLLFFFSVLFHEMSHSLVANSHGVRVDRITLFIFGGMSHLTRESPSPKIEMRIAAAGPLASFVLGAGFYAVSRLTPDPGSNIWAGMAGHLGLVNIALGVFNMLPGIPLDGGRVLRAWSWARSGDRIRATGVAAAWGKALGWVLIGMGAVSAISGNLVGGIWMVFIGLFVKEAAEAERRQAMVGDVLAGLKVAGVMIPDPITIPSYISVQDAISGYFLQHGYGGYPVTRDEQTVGLLSLADLTRCEPDQRERTTVAQIMSALQPGQSVGPDDELITAMRVMASGGISRLPVIAEGKLVGLVTLQAVARLIKIREIALRRVA